MKEYLITVNGVTYEVQVEEGSAPSAPVKKEAPVPQQKPAAAPPAPKKSSAPVGATQVKSPMPGTIIKINVKVGDEVKKGTLLCMLEAMKMENEIFSPVDGKVASVNVSANAAVESGQLLVSIS